MVNRSTSAKRSGKAVTRRQFGVTTGAAVLGTGLLGMALLDKPAKTYPTVNETVSIGDSGNPLAAFFVRPQNGKHPGVVMWRSGDEMTESEREEARDLAALSYSVLMIDRHAGDARHIPNDAHVATWWLKRHQQLNMKAGIGTPGWALQRLEPVRRG